MSWLNLLYKVKNGSKPNPNLSISAKVLINYWKLPNKKYFFSRKKYCRCLDIRVILENVNEDIDEVAICLPFKTKKDNIHDLSTYLKNENFVSHYLKNRYRCLTLKDCPTYHFLQVHDNEKEAKSLCLYEICDSSKKIIDLNNGCALLVKILSNPKNLKEIKELPNENSAEDNKYNLYFQLRISGLSDQDICYNENISNDLAKYMTKICKHRISACRAV